MPPSRSTKPPWSRSKLPPRPVSDPTGYHDDLMSLRQALAALPVDQRHVVVLCDIEGLPAHEVALLLDITVASTKSRLRRGRM